ncbi:hypothetical protein NTJ90_002700 [Enterococcus hirae]|nr:hypothetical protein [Enterococcus hirae]
MNEADILETTYEDSCIIERLMDIEDSNTNITIQDYKKIYDNPISCALSQGQIDGLAVIEDGEMVNVSTDTYKLFVHPKIKLKKGDRITITQKASGLIFSLFATKPFYYPSHCEVNLIGSEKNG